MAKTTKGSAALQIDISPSPDAPQALTLRQQAFALTVTDKDSHRAALEFVRGGKQLQRAIEEHWSRITRTVDDMKRSLLTLKRQDLEPVEEAIRVVTETANVFKDADDRRVAEENRRLREAAEAKAQADRIAELERQEAQALQFEEGSPVLSPRENVFVGHIVDRGMSPAQAASQAGYKDAAKAGSRLNATQKIIDAIHARRTAAAIREQAEAKRQTPLDVQPVRKVETQTAKVAGVRNTTYYSCTVLDAQALIAAVIAGTIEPEALMPNQTYLNDQARQQKDLFKYPGCKLEKKTGLAG